MASNNSLNKQKDKLVQDLEDNIVKLEKSLKELKESIDKLQTGDGKYPYWNGNNAFTIIKGALSQYNFDSALVENIKDCQGAIK